MGELVVACTKLWTILAVCMFMAVIAGFVSWFLEAHSNEEVRYTDISRIPYRPSYHRPKFNAGPYYPFSVKREKCLK